MSERPLLLVADDEPAVLNVIERFAKREGFDVVACPGGQVALDGLGARGRTSCSSTYACRTWTGSRC